MSDFLINLGQGRSTAIKVTILVLLLAVVVLSPLVYIWAFNTLASANIQYTFWTWLASSCFTSLLFNRK